MAKDPPDGENEEWDKGEAYMVQLVEP